MYQLVPGTMADFRSSVEDFRRSCVTSRVCLLLSVVFAQFWCAGLSFAEQPGRPNVIVIMTDDQGYGEFSCHGNPLIETPSIDQLASESVRLTDFHVSPMCTPTRGQLLTGLDAFRNGAINVSSGRTLLRPELKTMANVFREAGYRTGIFGKWHLGDNYPFRPEDRGFDEALWFPSSHINSVPDFWDNDYFDDTYLRNGEREVHDGYCTDVFFQEAMNWLESNDSDQPSFAYIPLNSAHWPWFVPEKYRQEVQAAVEANPEVTEHLLPQKRKNLISFLAMGSNIDDNVGRLLRFLDDKDLANNTIVVFLTDNGSTMGPDYFNAGMRGKKTTLWEGGHRVPCFVRFPNVLQAQDVSTLSHVQDLLPTLADLVGCEGQLPENLDGESLAPIFRGETDSIDDRMLVINYSRMPTFRVTYTDGNPAIPRKEGACVMWKNWRFLENRMLFDVSKDLHQDHNVAAENPEVVEAMRSHLNKWWDGVKDQVMEPQRVIIGHSSENPMLLSACEWLDVFVDQQIQIRRGVEKNGVSHVEVAEPGTYEFELRRWPRESGFRLSDGCPEVEVTDGTFVEGKALPIHQGRLRIGSEFDQTVEANSEGTCFQFKANLNAGPIELESWMLDSAGNEVCGAYYVYVNRFD
ncbi:Arylsulfatase [Thalassoglobus neptunius]|uniref:Arylsulfatase n=1 Tax=Thalassoglobus neptunius TaxID=1938619 RepID=A0A5C5UYE3_9PLAN|nr:arylsulfatase [Thalassoglobus neptunius]TWT30527.1 Arylsulfatase [Thalassoglobus neptunius]